MSFSNDNLPLLGNIAPAATSATYTRMITPKSLPSRFVEFLTSSVTSPAPPLPASLQSLYVSINTPLYFSDNPAPVPTGGLIASVGNLAKEVTFRREPTAAPVGLELYDGSPVAVAKQNGSGPITGLTATAKDGTAFNLAFNASNALVSGRGGNPQTTWIFIKAELSVGGESQFVMSLGYSPEDLLASLSISHQNIVSSVSVDLAPATGAGGYAKATRSITYYGETVSSTAVNVTDGAPPPVQLATSPLHQFISMIDLMPVAVATVLGQVAGQSQSNPLTSLGSIDIQSPETQEAYVNRGMALTAPACAQLGVVLIGSSIPGLASLAQLLGWSMGTLGAPYMKAALTNSYTNFQAWAAKQGVGSKVGGWRTFLDKDGLAQQAIDQIFDKTSEH
jgi:hypothetical protein